MPLMQRNARKADLLRCLPELANASTKDLVRVSRLFDEIDYAEGAVLMSEGDIGRQAFLIVEGTVEVSLRGRRLAVLGAGELVGEMALMDGERRSATVTTRSDVRALVASSADFAEFVDEPSGWRALARAMSSRLRTQQPSTERACR